MQNKKSENTKALNKAIIYEGYGAVMGKTKFVRESPSGRLTIVAIGSPSESLSVAIELVNDGVELIELCGYIPLIWKVKIIEAVGNKAKVSSVTFGIESLLLAAAFSKSYEEGNPPREAYIILEDGSNADTDRFEKVFDFQHTTFIPVPDETTAVKVASELAESGYGLIELYGGFSTAGASKIIEAVTGRVSVGVGSFTLEETNSQIHY
jgi:2-keto-3-deoxy-6-phosphogluconate aldolase